MDLCINVENYKLNIRATGIIIHNNKLLVHRDINLDHYALMGGRIAIGESSEETVKREFNEEIGKEVEIIGYVGTVENFFEIDSQKYHEIIFIYQLEFVDEKDKKIEETLKNIEGHDYLQYEWLDLDKLEDEPLKPEVIKTIIKNGKFPVHKINIDKKV